MQNVVKTLRILEEVAAHQPVGVGALSRRLTMPKSSVQRALNTLHAAGWIRPAGGEITRWVVTTKALRVGRQAAGELSLRDVAMPVLEELRERTGETIHLMVPEDDKVVLIERLQTPKPVRIVLALGSILPIHASANGKAVLACRPDEEIERLLAGGLPRLTDTTITDPDRLRAELREIRSCGYAGNHGEWRSDIAAVAAAVTGADGRPIASVSVSTPIARMPAEQRAEYGKLVHEAAGSISGSLEPE